MRISVRKDASCKGPGVGNGVAVGRTVRRPVAGTGQGKEEIGGRDG